MLFLICCFPCISYALIDYPIVTSANVSTSWQNRPSGTTSELTNWVLADGSPVRPILFVRDQGWSQQGTYKPAFAFGFFSNRTSSNRLFYLVTLLLPRSDDDFILTPPVIVWVANRDRPVGENATLSLTAAGDLRLRDADGSLAWSTNTAGRSVSSLNFSDGGNLMLLDNRNSVRWQSFDYPSDTWLPTQNIAFGNRLVARNSSSDVLAGQYYLSATRNGIHAFIRSNPPRRYGARRFRSGFIRDTTLGNSGSIQALSNSARFNVGNYSADGFRYIVLEPNGQLNVYQLDRVYSVLFNVILAGNLLAGSN